MPDSQTFLLFIAAGLLLNLTPGPDMALVIARSAQGLRLGVAAALGISAGCLVHAVAAALGLSALLATSATAFNVVKWIGAAYLLYIGVTMLLASRRAPKPDAPGAAPAQQTVNAHGVFMQGFLTNVLNPKVALFFLAFLPQFVDPAAADRTLALFMLGLVFVLNGTGVCLGIAWLGSRAASRLRHAGGAHRVGVWLERLLGVFFIALAARLAFAKSP